MKTLNQNDSFIGGTKAQYKKIFNSVPLMDPKIKKYAIESCFIRGGVFWSDRKKSLIPGELRGQKTIAFNDFLNRLKNTISHE